VVLWDGGEEKKGKNRSFTMALMDSDQLESTSIGQRPPHIERLV